MCLFSGELFNPVGLFNNAASNIICQLVMGKRFDYSDHRFQTLLRFVSKILQINGSIWGQVRSVINGRLCVSVDTCVFC